MISIGIDPGLTTYSIASIDSPVINKQFNYNDYNKNLYRMMHAIEQHFINFDIDEHIPENDLTLIISLERQFDRSKEKKLEQIVAITKYICWTLEILDLDIVLLMFSPTQLKKYVTGNGKADESEFWRRYERDKAYYGFNIENNDQHMIEASLYSHMGEAWFYCETDSIKQEIYPKYIKDMMYKIKREW